MATQTPGEGAKRLILADWVSSGPAPLWSDVAVYENGTIVAHGMDIAGYRARLRRRDLSRLRDDLASSAFVSALGHLAGDDVLHRDDQETVTFNIGDGPEAGYEMCSDVPTGFDLPNPKPLDAAVAKLVGDLNDIGHSLFGKQFYRGLPVPSPCYGPRDAAKEPYVPPGPPARAEVDAAIAAAAVPKPVPRGVARTMVHIEWLPGGQEILDQIEIFEDGNAVLNDIGARGRAARLSRRDLIRLRDDLANAGFVAALGRMQDEGNLYDGAGARTVGFTVGRRPVAGYHVCSDLPADLSVAKFVGHLNAAGESLFGPLFHRLPLPGPCPAVPERREAPKKPAAPPPDAPPS